LTQIIDEVARINGELTMSDADKVGEGKKVINDIAGMIYEMRHDKALTPLECAAHFSSPLLGPHELTLLSAARSDRPS